MWIRNCGIVMATTASVETLSARLENVQVMVNNEQRGCCLPPALVPVGRTDELGRMGAKQQGYSKGLAARTDQIENAATRSRSTTSRLIE